MGEQSEEVIAFGIGYLIEQNNKDSIPGAHKADVPVAKRLGLDPTPTVFAPQRRSLGWHSQNQAELTGIVDHAVVLRQVLPAVAEQLG